MIKAVIFDIGGVLEMTPPTGWLQRWANQLGVAVDEVEHRLASIFDSGSTGAITLARYFAALSSANASRCGPSRLRRAPRTRGPCPDLA